LDRIKDVYYIDGVQTGEQYNEKPIGRHYRDSLHSKSSHQPFRFKLYK
jgi:hypothetical protein